jgi:TctA family transporter
MYDILANMAQVMEPSTLFVIAAASFFGILMGAIPGLSATTGAALLVPLTLFMEPFVAMSAVIAMAASAIFAGDIPAFLLRVPGTAASAAYTDDGYRISQAGRPKFALMTSCLCSVFGGIFATLIFTIAAPTLARVALSFSAVEYFWLACLGLTCAAFMSSDEPLKGVASLLLGLAVSLVGLDVVTGYPRFTFGLEDLSGGISFIPALIGMFAISQIMRGLFRSSPTIQASAPSGVGGASPQAGEDSMVSILKSLRKLKLQIFRGSVTGTFIGVLPGAGADIAAYVSYSISKRFSRHPERFGKGEQEGIAEASASNNAAVGGAWIPSLVLGIPGDTITAIALGVLIMKGAHPGPTMFIEQPGLVGSLIGVFLLSNLLLFPVAFVVVALASKIMSVSRPVMDGLILIFCLVGAYAIGNSMIGVWVMLAMGVVGFCLEWMKIPLAPMILGMVLGPMIESNLIRSLIKSGGSIEVLYSRPIAAALALMTVLSVAWILASPLIKSIKKKLNNPSISLESNS